ncbi:MAG: YlxM family DNA-binding protein [Clostridia bacterium]|nr:YlxM family DNA-binding protein [Clostridia bacterium]MBQ1374859.1 YlxM family DNA-binding protein [Clostridia bacterium]MBQ1434317.1 YlxM family DNA-binding protein [Clostridia bacterium]MBQ4249027.1 YlxM family DNA-binding protein [Clostridia bacterium]
MHGKDFRINLLLDYYGETLTERQREVMDLYYNEDMSLFEISEHVGVTRQGVHDLIKRSENALVELDGKLGFVDRFSEIDRAADVLEEALSELSKSKDGAAVSAVEKIRSVLAVLKADREV